MSWKLAVRHNVGLMTLRGPLLTRVLTRIFVDSVLLHRIWHCHRRADRSFFVHGRQFHLCSRCTGLVCGVITSAVLLPFRVVLPPVFALFLAAFLIDGTTQFLSWRESTNRLRFVTGLLVGLTAIPAALAMGGF
jgi:uncharacterized membrane protein